MGPEMPVPQKLWLLKCKDNCRFFTSGMQAEGIYRLSGNKNDIEALISKFDAGKYVDLSFLIDFERDLILIE